MLQTIETAPDRLFMIACRLLARRPSRRNDIKSAGFGQQEQGGYAAVDDAAPRKTVAQGNHLRGDAWKCFAAHSATSAAIVRGFVGLGRADASQTSLSSIRASR